MHQVFTVSVAVISLVTRKLDTESNILFTMELVQSSSLYEYEHLTGQQTTSPDFGEIN